MNTRTLIAAALIIVGILAFVYQGFTYTTTEDKVNIGPLKVTAEETHTIPVSPLIGGITLALGVLLLATRGKQF